MYLYLERLENGTWVNTGSVRVTIPADLLVRMKPIPKKELSEPARSFFLANKRIGPIAIDFIDVPHSEFRSAIEKVIPRPYHGMTIRLNGFEILSEQDRLKRI